MFEFFDQLTIEEPLNDHTNNGANNGANDAFDIRNKPFIYDTQASRRLAEDWVDTIDVKNTLTYGDVDFDKSNIKEEGGKLYIIYGKTKKGQEITLEVINYPEKAVLRNIIKNDKPN